MTRASDLARLLGAGATINDGTTITTADNTSQLILQSTDADANAGPLLDMKRDSSSPADGDFLGQFNFLGENDASEEITYAQITGRTVDVSDGTEDGRIAIKTMRAGSSRSALDFSATETVFNDDGDDVDFRVESDNDTHGFFLQGSTGNVGIGDSTPDAKLDVHGNVEFGDGGGFDMNINGTRHQFSIGGTERMRIDSSGRVKINTTAHDAAQLNITANLALRHGVTVRSNFSGNSGHFITFTSDNGSNAGEITHLSATSVNYSTSSDYRLKNNITYNFDATTRLKQLKPARFSWNHDTTNTLIDGFLAHEVSHDADGNALVPEAITGEKDATNEDGSIKAQSIDQSKLIPLLVKTIQELEARISSQETNINDLQKRVTAVEGS